MNPEMNNWLQLIFRWGHVVAGIMWIGHLWFFNFVNGPFQGKLDGPTKKVVNPELMPRALYWFRWGAAWTWLTGVVLIGLIYYHSKVVFEDPNVGNPWLWLAIMLGVLAVGFVVYNLILKTIKNVVVASIINLLLLSGVYCLFEQAGHFSGRSLYIHIGAIFGTMMALNVWMVIWPSQKKMITATKEGTAADPEVVRQAGLRSRQNTYMSMPLVFLMISNHYPTVYGAAPMVRFAILVVMIAVGFGFTKLLYGKATKVAGF
jgi:Predicted membrane protein